MLPKWKFLGLLVLLISVGSNNSVPIEASFKDVLNPLDARSNQSESFFKQNDIQDVNENFKSIIYNLTITPNFYNSSFDGLLLLNVTTKRSVSTIVLSKGDYYVKVRIAGVKPSDQKVIQDSQKLVLELAEPLQNNTEYVISMSFRNLKIRSDMTGFYKSHSSKTEWIYPTNFKPNHASKVFPCFNNPAVKSTFVLNIKLTPESDYRVLANSDINSIKNNVWSFKNISNISAHNLAFVILKNFSSTHNFWNGKTNITLTVKNQTHPFTTFAYQKVVELMDRLEQTFGVEYPLEKLDVVVIPDYEPREISNLGLIILPENSLLYDKEDQSVLEELKIIRAISHAMASIWLQNIVTPLTWDSAWVGQGLAKYYEYFASEDESRKSDLMDQFLMEVQQKSLLEDGLDLNSKTIRVDRMSSIFRMIETFSGIENFTKSVRNYVKRGATEPAGVEDLFEAFDDQILPNWLNRTGYPVLNMSFNLGAVDLSAETFSVYPSRSIKNESWKIPFELLDVDSGTTKAFLLDLNSAMIKVSNSSSSLTIISRKRISGYYRVNYDNETWNKIVKVLNSNNYTKISTIDRSAILDDMFNLARAGSLNYQVLFEALKYLKNESEYLPMKTAINGLSYLLKAYESEENDEHFKKLLNWIRDIFKPIYDKLNETQINNPLFAREIMNLMCSMGDSDCIESVKTTFEESANHIKSISGDLRLAIYCNALKFEDKKPYFDIMLQKLMEVSIPGERLDILVAVGCYNEFEELKWFLKESMSSFEKFGIYEAELVKVIESIYSSSLKNSEQMLLFLKAKYPLFDNYFNNTRKITDMISKIGTTHQSYKMIKVLSELKKKVPKADLSEMIRKTVKLMRRELQTSNMITQKLAKVFEHPDFYYINNISEQQNDTRTTDFQLSSNDTTTTTPKHNETETTAFPENNLMNTTPKEENDILTTDDDSFTTNTTTNTTPREDNDIETTIDDTTNTSLENQTDTTTTFDYSSPDINSINTTPIEENDTTTTDDDSFTTDTTTNTTPSEGNDTETTDDESFPSDTTTNTTPKDQHITTTMDSHPLPDDLINTTPREDNDAKFTDDGSFPHNITTSTTPKEHGTTTTNGHPSPDDNTISTTSREEKGTTSIPNQSNTVTNIPTTNVTPTSHEENHHSSHGDNHHSSEVYPSSPSDSNTTEKPTSASFPASIALIVFSVLGVTAVLVFAYFIYVKFIKR